ncbi:MAG: transcription-repair coupling factor, partial [Proteobacteria bacterium]|nr:transcription-repair coupling factor [Pseudomonadota bacterium]
SPETDIVEIPAWDCLPYDRVSPRSDIISRRIDALTRLVGNRAQSGRLIVTTVAGANMRLPTPKTYADVTLSIEPSGGVDRDAILAFLTGNGFGRTETVMEPGEYAIRGSIIDLFPPGHVEPVRLDFFGDQLEGIRGFDALSQRTTEPVDKVVLKPISELTLDEESIRRFRTGYRALFGTVSGDDPLYEAISNGQHFPGIEHWLPLFYEGLSTVLDYVPAASVVLDYQSDEAEHARWELIEECYEARTDIDARGLSMSEIVYRPVPADRLYVDPQEWKSLLDQRRVLLFQPFEAVDGVGNVLNAGGKPGRDFADARALPDVNLYDALKEHVDALQADDCRTIIAALSRGSAERLAGILNEHGIKTPGHIPESWSETASLPIKSVAVIDLGFERGFTGPGLSVISEQDLLGERLGGPTRPRIRPENFISETSSLGEGDLVVHLDHGIGRYEGLTTLDVAGAAHDCLNVSYAGGDRLFVPVENIEVLSRYGEETTSARLDKLGGAAWQARRATLKKRIRDMAERLINVAAARAIRSAEIYQAPTGLYDEFCAGFPYVETEDQANAIEDVVGDLASGQPMDRLVCGDVGFGKTEVAMRAAFVTAMEGKQVAIVVPTTLLARQHYQNFVQRFADFPIHVRQLSRLVHAADAKMVRQGLADGSVDIVIGTHALLAKSIEFDRIGLLIIDEEQHFGVAHKERLKEIKTDVHVLTLTATPIPRTLQLSLSGVRDMSLITTPPVDRLAVRTFVLPSDPVVLREALMREKYRGGQSYYVCPRIADLGGIRKELSKLVPELKLVVAHGQMTPDHLEDVMTKFCDGAFDVLISTNIIESGIDLPTVNTIVIHRADRFGLAQLYQLRGRIGRAKVRGYAYLTLPPRQILTTGAQRRLEVMQTLDSLGAGFMLASHDLDIRGAGNLLGEEQSGEIREVGIELYQQMLEEAVAEAKYAASGEPMPQDQWVPQIDVGLPVLIPESYVGDLGLRLALYRRAAQLGSANEAEGFAAELIDRFGSLPVEVENLLKIVSLKRLCRDAGVEKVEAGPKGAVVTFRGNDFSNLAGLVEFITTQSGTAKLRPDQRLVLMRTWDNAEARFNGVHHLMRDLAGIAAAVTPAAA